MNDIEKQNKTSQTDVRPDNDENVEAIIDNLPPSQQNMVRMSMTMAKFMEASPENSISDKINEGHISKYLESAEKNMENTFKDKNRHRIFLFGVFALSLFAVIIISNIFKENPDMVEKILYGAGGLVAGALGGFGYGRSKKDDE